AFKTNEQVLAELLAQTNRDMEARIVRDQRTLYGRVNAEIRANMKAAFDEAGDEQGAGMKHRILGVLARHAKRVSQVMFDDARDALLSGVSDLNDWLKLEYEKMIVAVRQAGELAAKNMVSGGERLSAETIGQDRKRFTDLETVLAAVAEGAA